MRTLMMTIGLMLVMTGVAAADSDKIWVPAMMLAVGIVLIRLSMPAREEDE